MGGWMNEWIDRCMDVCARGLVFLWYWCVRVCNVCVRMTYTYTYTNNPKRILYHRLGVAQVYTWMTSGGCWTALHQQTKPDVRGYCTYHPRSSQAGGRRYLIYYHKEYMFPIKWYHNTHIHLNFIIDFQWCHQSMIETGAPTRWKSDKVCPTFYQCNSWTSEQIVPWNDVEKRVMYPSLFTLFDFDYVAKLTLYCTLSPC